MTLPRIAPDVVHEALGDEWVLVNMKTNKIFALNQSGARFWELYSEGKDREEIEATMLAEFDVDAETLTSEIDSLLDALAAEGIVIPAAD